MQGFNMGRYVPPDQEGLTSANKLAGKHPLGSRARHLNTTGALVVRFEMPFAVWCTTCKPHETIIGQGVRFNAEKKKVGSYYSTPIYSFRMKHTACGGWIEIRTDPQNTAYVVTEGGRKRDTGEEKDLGLGEIAIKLRGEGGGEAGNDPLARLEGKVEDKRKAETEQSRIFDLQRRQNRDWEDPYAQSRRLRRGFRTERKVLENAEAKREALKDKMSLGIDLVDETEEDRLRAGMVDFGPVGDATTRSRPMFESSVQPTSKASPLASGSKHGKRPKTTNLLGDRKALLRSELTSNTRAAVDPFLSQDANTWQPESKRRKTAPNKPTATVKGPDDNNSNQPSDAISDGPLQEGNTSAQKQPGAAAALVAYASDSD
ncbi:DUF572-domain-containing protein [Aspergillus steynii IBT 23096]|uniref:DUF572-domain-containing protein n=1 Tax=Aspergillus steynii IBT 23096 TaxID=1392250 RepID=A0A2I2GR50_9EURO|nr:DUF572-domain-containing protein [Aspergillus steynii IBT 23096]PLB55362.1 DUF572-domain-containing protein [Aspergillus steynii IBT 23096]